MSDEFYSTNAGYLSKKNKAIEAYKVVAARIAAAILKAAPDYAQFGVVISVNEGCLLFEWHGLRYSGAFSVSFPPGKKEQTVPTEARLSVVAVTDKGDEEEEERSPLFTAQFDSLGNVEQSYLPEDFAGFFFNQLFTKLNEQSLVFHLQIEGEEPEDFSVGSPGSIRREFDRGQ